ncbi:unnamed protein product [Prorocentrum cordatum]|uniref:Uncharacterized protein n=1 Tax=Prorocentrum cordatum TaxID=2364126 RepID=A0ABN9Q2Z3_9DINO|nr:unnamed protein product [Polarella glacialis]
MPTNVDTLSDSDGEVPAKVARASGAAGGAPSPEKPSGDNARPNGENKGADSKGAAGAPRGRGQGRGGGEGGRGARKRPAAAGAAVDGTTDAEGGTPASKRQRAGGAGGTDEEKTQENSPSQKVPALTASRVQSPPATSPGGTKRKAEESKAGTTPKGKGKPKAESKPPEQETLGTDAKSDYSIMTYPSGAMAVRPKGKDGEGKKLSQLFQVSVKGANPDDLKSICEDAIRELQKGRNSDDVKLMVGVRKKALQAAIAKKGAVGAESPGGGAPVAAKTDS